MLDRFASVLVVAVFAGGCGGSAPLPDTDPASLAPGAEPTREQMDAWWKLYQRDDPKWPAARDRWIEVEGRSGELLVLSLIREMVQRAPVRNADGSLAFRKPQTELLALPESKVEPVLMEAIRVGKDRSALDALGDTLVEIGSTDAVFEVLDHPREGDSLHCPAALQRVLVRIGGEKAVSRVRTDLVTAPDWQRRSSAAEAFRMVRRSDRDRAIDALTKALHDADPFVTRTALKSLGVLGDAAAAPPIAAALVDYRAAKDADTIEEAVGALRTLTQRRVEGDDPARWKEVAAEAAAASRIEKR